MTTESYKVRDVQPTLLRLDPELRARLTRDAKANGRSLTKECELRLLQTYEPGARGASTLGTAEPKAEYALSATEASLLKVLRKLSPEKQLALLSLLK